MDGTSLLAYIDPGIGSMFLQAALAGLFAMLFFFSRIKNWLRTHFRCSRDRKDE
jgi:hypothetical protein